MNRLQRDRHAFGSEISTARVASAIGLTRAQAVAKIRNARVVPHWIAGRDIFWYRRELEEGCDFVRVDAESGEKCLAFDRQLLAQALSQASGEAVDASNLPVREIVPLPDDGWQVSLQLGKRSFRCTTGTSVECVEVVDPVTAAGLQVSPDRKIGVFTRDHNLWQRDLITGREKALTDDGAPNFGYGLPPDTWGSRHLVRQRASLKSPPFMSSWSPDSRWFLVPRVDQRHVAGYPYLESVPQDGSFRPKAHEVRMALVGERPDETHWLVIDIKTGSHIPVQYPAHMRLADAPGHNVLGTWWNDDGRSFLQLMHAPDLRSGSLFEVDALTGRVRTVVEESVPERPGLHMFNGGNYAAPIIRILGNGREAILYSARDGWGHLYLHDIASGTLTHQITRGEWLVRDIVRVDEQRREIFFVGAGREPGNPYHRYLYRVAFDGSDLILLTPDEGDHLLVDPRGRGDMDGTPAFDPFSPSGSYFVCDVSTVDRPTHSTLRRTATAETITTFEKADASALFASGYRPPEEVAFKAADGQSDLHGLVYRPSDYDPAKKYAVIDVQYCSPIMAITPRHFSLAATLPIDFMPPAATAELGFIVVVVDARGTPGRSRSFSTADPGYLADMGLVDHIAFIRALARRDSAVDLSRVAISGVSFGGWTSIRAMLDHSDFFAAAVSGAPPGTFHSLYHAPGLTALEGMPRYEDAGMLRPCPTAVPANFAHIDSVRQIDRLRGPLLLVMGELDENVVPGSTLQFYDAAMKADKDVDLIFVPNATHGGFYTPYVMRRVWSFWLRELNGESLPRGTSVPGM